ncbi:MAG: 30S ribosomal protein S8 [Candidatus Nanohaloarchaea archaeon]
MQHDTLADAFSSINNASDVERGRATVSPATNLIKNVLIELQDKEYIGVFELVEDGRGGEFKVDVDSINQIEPVKPNFFVGADEFTKWEKRFLPAKDFGHLIVTTPKGVMTHDEAKEKNVGGKLLGYVY